MRSPLMRTILPIFLVVLSISVALPSYGQKQKKRPPKQENVQTRESAKDKDATIKAEKVEAYKGRVKQHESLQDKKTRKRMKKTYKQAQKQSVGREAPFYKRWFRKRHI